MLQRPVGALDERDLLALVANHVAEDRGLEFKRDLPGKTTADVKEYLADVTSLANSHGGDLIYGVEDRAGVASAVPGVASDDPDGELLRLESSLRDGVEPRLSGVRMRWISLATGRGAIIIRVPAGLAAPHRVKFQNSGRFYSRNSRGKYEMDTHELRQAFTASEELPTRIRDLHKRAVLAAEGSDMPFRIDDVPRAVVSIIPLGFFRERRDLDITPANAVAPFRVAGEMGAIHMLEGILLHTKLNEDTMPHSSYNAVRSYALTHRMGRTDAAWTIGKTVQIGKDTESARVWPKLFESGLLDMARTTAAKLREFTIEGPWVVLVTISKVKGFELVLGERETTPPAWLDGATLPDLIVDRLDADSLSPAFKAFWLLFGTPRPHHPGYTP